MEIGSPICLRHGHRHVHRNVRISLSTTTPTLLSTKSENSMFILGLGFVGQTLARKLQNQRWTVSGTCTTHVKKKKLEDMGFHVHLFDANHPDPSILQQLRNYTHFLVSVPPVVGIGDPMLQHEELIRSSLVNGDLKWLSYLSSTSVYGDCDGELVDEDYPTNPENESAKLRLNSELGWSNLAHHIGLSPLLFRLGGIYGPGRSAVDTIIKQKPLSEGQKRRKHRKYTSRVHVDDICQALMATIDAPSSSRVVYNIVDDDSAPREEVFEYARKLVEKKWPDLNLQHLEQKDWSIVKTRNKRGEKRVSNALMKKELGVQLLYPDYRSGLQSIIDQIENPFICN
ncbi:putative NAD(P)-binding domain-containing protein [Medicago truncatula]|uniref:NAD-dependent epimerase/dehydratase family protein n=1 Tax=Medicago truncatula TaxID=3880 RepID=G7I5C0_MEDTR|nr:protein YeeZ isoform X3 [Medicago truncatula]AES59572.2 NAD-dependent epimerase/dehydratase family protein [Medicago truncatula]RHN77510.1 putative NAD(P)-binding domain-containing protein [Medicago truncatula]